MSKSNTASQNESRPEERISGLLVCSRPASQSGSLLVISQPYLLSRADSTCHAAGASCLRMTANQEGGRPQTGLFQPFATVPTSCLVVSQHEDMAVFHDIAVDIVVRGAVVPDSAIAGYSRDGFCGDVPGDDVQVEMPAHVIGHHCGEELTDAAQDQLRTASSRERTSVPCSRLKVGTGCGAAGRARRGSGKASPTAAWAIVARFRFPFAGPPSGRIRRRRLSVARAILVQPLGRL